MTDGSHPIDRSAARLPEALTAIFGNASPASVFSPPETVGDTVVITAAAWERAGGFGFGGSAGSVGGGGGGGGGGSSVGRPVAIIRIGPAGVDVQPVIDFTKLGVTVLLSAVGVWRALRR